MALTGDRVVALQTLNDAQSATGTTTSTTYTATLAAGGTACGKVFVAPASGSVVIHNATQIQASAGNSFCTIRVRTGDTIGSGTDVLPAGDDDAVITNVAAVVIRAGVDVPVDGLTPGNTYNAQQLFKNDAAGTCTVSRKKIIVKPQP